MTTPTNKGLTDNLLPLWTGRELSEIEKLELFEEVEGKTGKGNFFNYSNKNTIVLKTQVYNNLTLSGVGSENNKEGWGGAQLSYT